LPWADVSGVGALAQVSKPWLNETQVQALWRDFVVDRWRVVAKHAPRVYGAPTWQLVYRNFLFQLKIPRSPFSRSTNAVFGRGRLPGVCTAWVLVKHRSDCRTRSSNQAQQEQPAVPSDTVTSALNIISRTNRPRPSIELRLIVQNTGPNCASLRVEVPHEAMQIMNGNTETKATLVERTQLVSVNGEKSGRGSSGSCEGGRGLPSGEKLGPLDFGVYSIHVEAKNCAFETDFLARARALELLIHSRETPSQPERTQTVMVEIVDEATVWEHYEELPGGFMVLVDSPRTRFTTTEERFGRVA